MTRPDFTELKQELAMLKLETRFVNILIGYLYRPPSAPTSFWGALDQQLEEVLGVEHPPPTLLLTGDLNVDFLDTKHPRYNHLHSFLAAHNLGCPETLFISHENANFLFSCFRVVQGEAKTPKIMWCCRANFAFLHALKIGAFRGK